MPPQPIILVDCSNISYRVHFVSSGLQHEGQPTSVLYGFLRAVYNLREKVSPRMVFCWDGGIPTGNGSDRSVPYWRKALLPEYKANRKHTNDHLIVQHQLPLLHQALSLLGYSSVGVPGLEADDLFGILSRHWVDTPLLLYSADRDLYQLLNDRIRILLPGKVAGQFRYITPADVVREYSVPISQWAAYLALGGDSSDNIKPMRGMGPKTAVKLLQAGLYPWHEWNVVNLGKGKQFDKYKESWPQIQKAYSAARLPIHWEDSRIAAYTKSNCTFPLATQHWTSQEAKRTAQESFRKFCGQYGLLEMLTVYRRFFQESAQ